MWWGSVGLVGVHFCIFVQDCKFVFFVGQVRYGAGIETFC